MFRQSSLLSAFALAATLLGSEPDAPARFERVAVAPAKTSFYIGTITMLMPEFTRSTGGFASSYEARIFPFPFANESGRIVVEVTDEQLRQLTRGETLAFTGRGIRTDGAERKITGTATPLDASHGSLKVRVHVSKRIELVFDTTYRFVE